MTALCGWCTSPSATANPPFQSQQAQLESGVRGNVPAPFGAGERLQSPTYRYRKGQGKVKNGNPYLGWAYMEAAQFALRFHARAQRFYQRKLAKSNNNMVLARKTVAHKLARACYYLMRDLVPFDAMKALG